MIGLMPLTYDSKIYVFTIIERVKVRIALVLLVHIHILAIYFFVRQLYHFSMQTSMYGVF
jgi:hypothetical protein